MGRYPASRYVNDGHEYISHLTRETAMRHPDRLPSASSTRKSNVARWNGVDGDRRCRGNTWFVPYRTIRSRHDQRPHPAAFPVKIPRMCVRLHGLDRARRVMDPFLGIGASAVACVQLGVDFAGFETDAGHCRQSRLAAERAADVARLDTPVPG